MTRLRKVIMKPLRKRQAWLPLATHAVAAGLNSPTAKQILALSRKSKGSEVNGHIVSLGLSRVHMLLHTTHWLRLLEAISVTWKSESYQLRGSARRVKLFLCMDLPQSKNLRLMVPNFQHSRHAPEVFPYRSTSTRVASQFYSPLAL